MTRVVQTVKKEFIARKFGLKLNHPEVFFRCQWQTDRYCSLAYLGYRCLVAVYFLVTLFMCMCNVGRNHLQGVPLSKWPIYLTNWGYTVYTIQALLGSGLLIHKLLGEDENDDTDTPKETVMNWCIQLYWVLHTIAVVIAFSITGSFWVAIYNPEHHELDMLSIVSHVLNSIVMGIDLFLVTHPIRLLHFHWPVGFLTSYFAFSVAYFCLGGTDRYDQPQIYSILDWYRPVRTLVICVIALGYVILTHVIAWALYLFRKWISQKVTKSQLPVQTETVIMNSYV